MCIENREPALQFQIYSQCVPISFVIVITALVQFLKTIRWRNGSRPLFCHVYCLPLSFLPFPHTLLRNKSQCPGTMADLFVSSFLVDTKSRKTRPPTDEDILFNTYTISLVAQKSVRLITRASSCSGRTSNVSILRRYS